MMKHWRQRVCGLLASVLLVALPGISAGQSIGDQSKDMFSGMMNNYTQPGVVLDSRRGVISGGSLEVRNKILSPTLYNVDLPRISAGCGGISAYFGSLSFISKEQVVGALKQIATNAVGYAFQLALSAMCPDCANELAKLQAKMNEYNNGLINSCKMAQSAMDSTGASGAVTSTFKNFKINFGEADDQSDAENQGETETSAKDMANAHPEKAKQIQPGNIIWQAMKRSRASEWLGNASDQLLEDIMSLTGTYVVCIEGFNGCNGILTSDAYASSSEASETVSQDGEVNAITLPPLLSLRDLIYGTSGGAAEIQRYTCHRETGPDECLSPHPVKVIPGQLDGFKQMLIGQMIGKGQVDPATGYHAQKGILELQMLGSDALTLDQENLLSHGGILIRAAVRLGRTNPLMAKEFVLTFADSIAAQIAYEQVSANLAATLLSLNYRSDVAVDKAREMVQAAADKAVKELNTIQAQASAQSSVLAYFQNLVDLADSKNLPAAPVGQVRN